MFTRFTAVCLVLAAVLASAGTNGTVAVNVCTGPIVDCTENCTLYAIDNNQCLTIPGAVPGTETSIKISCDFSTTCVGFTEYLLNENCSTSFGPNYQQSYFTNQCTVNMNKWIINANGTVSHYLNCVNKTTGNCANNLAECSSFKTFAPKTCGAQSAFGLNMSYYIDGESPCASYPATYTTFFETGNCKAGGHDSATHSTYDDGRCTSLLPFAKVSLNFKCVPQGASLPKATAEIMRMVKAKMQKLP